MNQIGMPKRVKFPLGDGTHQVVRIAVVDNNAHRMFGYNPLTNRLEDMTDLESLVRDSASMGFAAPVLILANSPQLEISVAEGPGGPFSPPKRE